jgi:outer membrane lipoprotein SlyB
VSCGSIGQSEREKREVIAAYWSAVALAELGGTLLGELNDEAVGAGEGDILAVKSGILELGEG